MYYLFVLEQAEAKVRRVRLVLTGAFARFVEQGNDFISVDNGKNSTTTVH